MAGVVRGSVFGEKVRLEVGLRASRAERGADDGYDGEAADGGAGDEDALGVGAGIGRGEQESGAIDEGAVVGGDGFELVAVGEGEAEPESGGSGAADETAAKETLRRGGVRSGVWAGVGAGEQFAHVADPFDQLPGDELEFAGVVEQLEVMGLVSRGGGGISGGPVTAEAAYDDGFACAAHWVDCRTSWYVWGELEGGQVAKLVTV